MDLCAGQNYSTIIDVVVTNAPLHTLLHTYYSFITEHNISTAFHSAYRSIFLFYEIVCTPFSLTFLSCIAQDSEARSQ